MAHCPKCGKKIKRKTKSLGYRNCRHCGPISKLVVLAMLAEQNKQLGEGRK